MYENVFQSIRIGRMTVKNRIAMAPMSMRGAEANFRNADGTPSDKLAYFWERRAMGGVGLLITDVITPDADYIYLGPTLSVQADAQVAALKKLTDNIHRHDCKVIAQLSHPGPGSMRGLMQGKEVVGPSDDVNTQMGNPVRELSVAEIHKIRDQYAEAALAIRTAGFDGIQLHCAHAYMLMGSFVSASRNKRTDEYGGTIEGRMKFPLEVLRAIKQQAGEDFPVIVRMSGDEGRVDGNHVLDAISMARFFEINGADALEISGGSYPETPEWVMPCQGMPQAINADNAAQIKKAVRIPILCVGGIRTVELADSLIGLEKTDMVVMGRSLLADPDLPIKSAAGQTEKIAPCIGCCDGCLGSVSHLHTSCVINPIVGEELTMEELTTEQIKKVAVIGGGPGGLMAARDCAKKGHQVTLIEKDSHLGGILNAANRAPFKQDVSNWTKYLINQAREANVNILLSQPDELRVIQEIRPDAIIIATGSREIIPPIKGLESAGYVTALSVLKGREKVITGKVLIIGGGIVGLEAADLISQSTQPTDITVVEMLGQVGKEYYAPIRKLNLARMTQNGIEIRTSTSIREITPEGVLASVNGEDVNLGTFDQIVIACGFKSPDVSARYKGLAREIYTIGDAVSARSALDAIAEGAKTARLI